MRHGLPLTHAPPHSRCTAGPGRLLVLTGGDDQSLRVSLLQLSCGSGSCQELLHLAIPNSHASALRAVWLGALSPPPTAAAAAPAAALEATAFTLGLDQQVRRWRIRLQQLATEGPGAANCATTASGSSNGMFNGADSGRYAASSGGWALAVEEAGCRFTQVCEPASLDCCVVPLEGRERHAVGVAGRGTELLPW